MSFYVYTWVSINIFHFHLWSALFFLLVDVAFNFHVLPWILVSSLSTLIRFQPFSFMQQLKFSWISQLFAALFLYQDSVLRNDIFFVIIWLVRKSRGFFFVQWRGSLNNGMKQIEALCAIFSKLPIKSVWFNCRHKTSISQSMKDSRGNDIFDTPSIIK